MKSQAQIVKETKTARSYHSCSDHQVWGCFITASFYWMQWQCRWSSGTWKKGARQKLDHNPRLPKNRLHQSRTTCSSKNPWDTAPWRERGAEELSKASSVGELTHTLHTTCNAVSGISPQALGIPVQETLVYWSESWERPLRCLKNCRFCRMRRNQASRDCLVVKTKPERLRVEQPPCEYLHLHLMRESKDDGSTSK